MSSQAPGRLERHWQETMWAAESGNGSFTTVLPASAPLQRVPLWYLEDYYVKYQTDANGLQGCRGAVLSPPLSLSKMADTVRKARQGDRVISRCHPLKPLRDLTSGMDVPYLQRGVGSALCKLSSCDHKI